MSARWATKYGPRRVRHEPPNLEEALYAAEGLATDADQQIEIAAELMQIPVDQVRADAQKILKGRSNRTTITAGGRRGTIGGGTTVLVERKPARRVIVTPERKPVGATLIRKGR